jgi:alkylation response protein AidB-like acyl-CoA dehydrogenase
MPPSMSLPHVQRLIEAAKGLAPAIEDARDAFDRERQLPQSLAAAMHEIGLFSLWLPAKFDGPELSLIDTARVIEITSQMDGAVGWCASIGTTYSRFAAFLPNATAHKIFVEDRAILSGSLVPNGKATAVPGGYRVTGRWAYGSGIQHSRWTLGSCTVLDNGTPRLNEDGTPETRTTFFPTESVEVIDTWDVGGLRGTGSHDFRINDLFVPHECTVKELGSTPTCSGPFYLIPPHSAYPIAIAAVPLGIAHAALDRFVKLASMKTPLGGTAVLREKPTVQSAIGRAEAALRSARAFLFEVAEEIWQVVEARESIALHHRALIRLACAQAAAAAKDAVQIVYDGGGGTSVYESSGLQRCFRDTYAAVQHVQVHTTNFELGGRVMLGLEPGTARF